MLSNLSAFELATIVKFLPRSCKYIGVTLPLLSHELHSTLQSDDIWQLWVKEQYPFYYDVVMELTVNNELSWKEGVKKHLQTKWHFGRQCIEMTSSSGGFQRSLTAQDEIVTMISKQLTVEFWIKNDNKALEYAVLVLATDMNWNGGFGFYAYPGNDCVEYYWYVYDWCATYTNHKVEKWREWMHVAGTFDGKNLILYFDGVAVGTNSTGQDAPILFTNNPCLYVGMGTPWGHTYDFDGSIADLRVWNTCHSAEEINFWKDSKLNGKEPGLIFFAPMNSMSSNQNKQEVADLVFGRNLESNVDAKFGLKDVVMLKEEELVPDKKLSHSDHAGHSLLEDLLLAYNNKGLVNDVTIVCSDGQRIQTARWLLSVRSPLFKELFSVKLDEYQVDEPFRLMKAVIYYIYTDTVIRDMYTSQELVQIYNIALRYELRHLQKVLKRIDPAVATDKQ